LKRLIAAGILFVLVLAAYLTGHFYIKNTCDTAKELLNECINAYETQNEAGSKAEKLKNYWTEKEKPLSFFAVSVLCILCFEILSAQGCEVPHCSIFQARNLQKKSKIFQ